MCCVLIFNKFINKKKLSTVNFEFIFLFQCVLNYVSMEMFKNKRIKKSKSFFYQNGKKLEISFFI